MTTGAVAPSAAALRLVIAAERLFALYGIDGISLRQIAAEAGSANNSAVHYHFGSKEGLIEAIFRHRLPQIINERKLLALQCDPDDLRSRIEAHFLPVLNMAEAPDNHYVSFVEQLQRRDLATGTAAGWLPEVPEEGQRSHDEFSHDLDRLLRHLDEPLRQMRIAGSQALLLHAAADRERAVGSGTEQVPFELFVSALLDGITAFAAAPASASTLRRLQHAGEPMPHRLRLL